LTNGSVDSLSAARALLAELAAWLVEATAAQYAPVDRFNGFCTRLTAVIPLSRISLILETLHPEDSGIRATWQEGTVDRAQMSRAGIATSSAYLNSPVYIVDETNQPFRWRAGEPTRGMELLDELVAEGTTDYLIQPLPFQDTTRTAAMSFATRAPGGFDDAAVAMLGSAAALYAPSAERVLLRQIAVGLLAAYVGPNAGAQVYEGRIDRGDVETLTAAILFADLRDFTAMSDALPRGEVVDLLNRWFDVLGDAVDAQGGEILKFMGDGLLAVFRVRDGAAGTCGQALDAALAARDGTARLAAELTAAGRAPIACGLALHLGDVAFGNIGTRRRLDFTVIGPAVNHASRLQGLTKVLGEPVLASAAFAAASGRSLRPLGFHSLRGVVEPIEVFGPFLTAPPRA
jgi:adenylate cyclase